MSSRGVLSPGRRGAPGAAVTGACGDPAKQLSRESTRSNQLSPRTIWHRPEGVLTWRSHGAFFQCCSSCSAECHPEDCLRPAAVVLLVLLLQARVVTLREERAADGHRGTISDAGSPMPPPLGAPAAADWQCCADAAAACAACPLVSPSLSTFCSLPCTLTRSHTQSRTNRSLHSTL